MSFLKQILKPFVEFDEAENNRAAQQGNMAPKAPVPPPASASPVVPAVEGDPQHPLISGGHTPPPVADQVPTFAPSGALTEPLPEHIQYFEKLIDDANAKNPLFQGTDFKEFIDSKLDIDDIADEAIRYRTAYNVLKSTGLTKEKLLSTGQEYLNLIGRDMNAFLGAHGMQYQKEVKQKEALINKKVEELQALTQRINVLKGEINQLTQDNNLTKEQLDTTKSSFLLAGERMQNEIQTELQKIAQYF
jgi:hypothetical protein